MNIYKKFRNYKSCNKGASAVEFALVAPIFFLVVFAIFEVGFIFLTDLAMESALTTSARLIRTGQVQCGKMLKETFQDELCKRTHSMINCDNINIEVGTYASFSDGANLDSLFDSKGELENRSTFSPGGPGSINIVRTTYTYDIKTPFSNQTQLSNYGDGKFLQVHIAAFIAEPFSCPG